MRFPVDVLLVNFIGAGSVGAAVRAADCAGVRCVYHSGGHNLETSRVAKASLGAEHSTPCERVVELGGFLRGYTAGHRGADVVLVTPDAPTPLHALLRRGRGGGEGDASALPPHTLLIFPNETHRLAGHALPCALAAALQGIPHRRAAPCDVATVAGGGVLTVNITAQVAMAVYAVAEVYDAAGVGATAASA